MKIGVLTYYKVLNYGAILQAYALQKVLKALGHDAFLVNYQPEELTKPYKSIKVKQLLNIGYCMRLYRRLSLNSPFKHFNAKYLKESITYDSSVHLLKDAPEADAYIVGSDQVWRTKLSGNDDMFFLPFGEKDALRISYAASCGGDYLFLDDENNVKLLQNFSSISVREKSLYEELSKIEISSEVVLDPTLLCDDYSEFIGENKYGDYIVVYNVHYNSNFRNTLKYLKKKTNLFVINIGPDHIVDADKNLRGVSPSEWINLLYHAKYVYTNSFHGVVFSINFKRNFLYIPNNLASDSRVLEFLSEIGLQSSIINNTENIDSYLNAQSSLTPNETLAEMKEKSFRFLEQSLNKEIGHAK